MSGDEERVSKRARKNYPGEVSFGVLSKEENEHSVAQVSRCTDTGNCTWTEDGTKPQLLGGLGEEGGGGSSLQMVEEEFGELPFLLGEPQIQYSDNTVRAKNLVPKRNIIAYRPMTKIQNQNVNISFSSRTAI